MGMGEGVWGAWGGVCIRRECREGEYCEGEGRMGRGKEYGERGSMLRGKGVWGEGGSKGRGKGVCGGGKEYSEAKGSMGRREGVWGDVCLFGLLVS